MVEGVERLHPKFQAPIFILTDVELLEHGDIPIIETGPGEDFFQRGVAETWCRRARGHIRHADGI